MFSGSTVFNDPIGRWQRTPLARALKRSRCRFMLEQARTLGIEPRRILDVGCHTGKDFLAILQRDPRYELHGVDLLPQALPESVTFTQADAAELPFEDGAFDLVVSVGVLEHIEPIDKLCLAAREIRRVGRAFVVGVPSIATLIEPHTGSLLWQLRDANRKAPYSRLHYLNDEAWLQLEGFRGARTVRRDYLPLLKQDLFIIGRP